VVAPIEQKDERWRENQNRNDVLAGRMGGANSMVGAGSDRATAQGIQLKNESRIPTKSGAGW
jgi:hypothetical protein